MNYFLALSVSILSLVPFSANASTNYRAQVVNLISSQGSGSCTNGAEVYNFQVKSDGTFVIHRNMDGGLLSAEFTLDENISGDTQTLILGLADCERFL